MATVPAGTASENETPVADKSSRRSKRRKTSHLKLVPETRELRERMRESCRHIAAQLDKNRPLTKDEMEQVSRKLLEQEGLGEGYLGWTMVVLASCFWEDQVAEIPPSRRLFLLPHCLKHAEGCPADYDEFGLDCETCGACSIADFRTVAEKMGYRVLVAEGSPIVLKIIVSGYVDAVVGVACLNVLEKAIDKILLAGIPCMAVPLLSSDCRNTSVDESWVNDMIKVEPKAETVRSRSYVHLMRAASKLFEPEELERLAPRLRGGPRLDQLAATDSLDPIASTEAIAYDFLGKGGKYARPFITLAVHDALTGGEATTPNGAATLADETFDPIKRAAMSIETFHKASLVHDDIEDDDDFRYGEPTMHNRFGTPTAINVGDYLIGLGYRLVSQETGRLGADKAAEIMNCLAEAHLRLSEGQGAELTWRDATQKALKPLDALRIYALKTAPAFEAALLVGARLAGDIEHLKQPLKTFSRNLGVAFQILNDLKDWQEDGQNKKHAGGDVIGGRPTLLLALALEGLAGSDKEELEQQLNNRAPQSEAATLDRVETLYRRADVFSKAQKLIEKHRERAEAVADELENEQLRLLLYYLVDSILDQPSESTAPQVITPIEMLAATSANAKSSSQ